MMTRTRGGIQLTRKSVNRFLIWSVNDNESKIFSSTYSPVWRLLACHFTPHWNKLKFCLNIQNTWAVAMLDIVRPPVADDPVWEGSTWPQLVSSYWQLSWGLTLFPCPRPNLTWSLTFITEIIIFYTICFIADGTSKSNTQSKMKTIACT